MTAQARCTCHEPLVFGHQVCYGTYHGCPDWCCLVCDCTCHQNYAATTATAGVMPDADGINQALAAVQKKRGKKGNG